MQAMTRRAVPELPPPSVKVSIGMPVHNGAATLRRALDSVLGQDHADLEVVLSDNASTDDTPTIARQAAEQDPRIRYFRQPRPIPAWENFRFVLEQATGDYFLWAADDDLHSPNYVDTLARALSADPHAVLAVTDVVRFYADEDPTSGTVVSGAGAEGVRTYAELVRDVILSPCSEFYGLFRTQCLREFPWSGFDYGPDHILLFYVRLRGAVVYAKEALFYESIRRTPKPRRQRVEQGFYRSIGRFRMVRFSWELAKVAGAAAEAGMAPRHRLRILGSSYVVLRATLARVYLYEHAPAGLVRFWRRLKPEQQSQPEPTA
jgi:glycosyltransferase involved in cell wall biosynthesis